jgi:hypothetical protein
MSFYRKSETHSNPLNAAVMLLGTGFACLLKIPLKMKRKKEKKPSNENAGSSQSA